MVQAVGVERILQSKVQSAILTIRAQCDPGMLERVVGVFTLRGLIPTFFSSRRQGRFLVLDVELPADDGLVDDRLLHKLRGLVGVDRADFVTRPD